MQTLLSIILIKAQLLIVFSGFVLMTKLSSQTITKAERLMQSVVCQRLSKEVEAFAINVQRAVDSLEKKVHAKEVFYEKKNSLNDLILQMRGNLEVHCKGYLETQSLMLFQIHTQHSNAEDEDINTIVVASKEID